MHFIFRSDSEKFRKHGVRWRPQTRPIFSNLPSMTKKVGGMNRGKELKLWVSHGFLECYVLFWTEAVGEAVWNLAVCS